MADEVSDVNIEKGVHLSVVVELCVQNIIVVCFKNKGKEFKGVLLESDGGFFPFSFPFLKSHPPIDSGKSAQKTELLSPTKICSSEETASDVKNNPQTPEISASTHRFSYNHDPFLVNPTPTPELTVVEMKPIAPRTKTIRDIRLRPRQTLCSNCKSAIHEGRKTRSNSSNIVSNQTKTTNSFTTATSDSRLRPRVNGTVSHISPRPAKRKGGTQTPMVLLEDIKHKSTRLSLGKDQKRSGNVGAAENEPSNTNKSNFESSVESLTNTTNRIRASRRSLLSESSINHEVNVQLNGVAKNDLPDPLSLKLGKKIKISNNEQSSRPSPAIKISIKGGAILKIPPRLPNSEGSLLSRDISEVDKTNSNSIDDSQIHKKAKKSAKKAKDRHRSDTNALDNILPNGDQTLIKSLKKHKKKHRHRHQSPEPIADGNAYNPVLSESRTYRTLDSTSIFSHRSNVADECTKETNHKSWNILNQGLENMNSFKQEQSNLSINNGETNSTDEFRVEFNDAKEFYSGDANTVDMLCFGRGMDYGYSSFNRETDNTNMGCTETNNMKTFHGENKTVHISREAYDVKTCIPKTNNYVTVGEEAGNVSRETCNIDVISHKPNVVHLNRCVDNNNVTFKVEETADDMMDDAESHFNQSGLHASFRQANSPLQQKQIKVGDCFIDVVDISDSDSDNESQRNDSTVDLPNSLNNSHNNSQDFDNSRPRLLYTWKQDQGLSRVDFSHPLSSSVSHPSLPPPPPPHASSTITQFDDQSPRYLIKTSPSLLIPNANSPHRRKNASPGRVINASPNVQFSTNSPLIKDYPLRNRTGSLSHQPTDLLMLAENGGIVSISEDSQSHSSGLESRFSDISGESEEDEHQLENLFTPMTQDEDDKNLSKPLMLKIQTQSVSECLLEGGRKVHVGDIVWGKIQGFPWWPGRVSSITVTRRDNNIIVNQLADVAWFGSNTMSHVHCCDLFPFLEDFKIRYNKKKKGPYKLAIKQATQAAQRMKLANGVSHGNILD